MILDGVLIRIEDAVCDELRSGVMRIREVL
jgi:hypothetical protein